MSTSAPPPAGWYPDPTDPEQARQRWWDGSQWTGHIHPPEQAQQTNGDATMPRQPVGEDAPTARHTAPAAAAGVTGPAGAGSGPVTVGQSERKIPRFGARKAAQQMQEELAAAEASLQQLGGLEHAQIQAAIEQQRRVLAQLTAEVAAQQAALEQAKREIVATEDVQILQEVGVYEYTHPLSDAAAYQGALKQLKDGIKTMARADGGAVTGATHWTVNGSEAQGRKMVRETSKLMLRAYNAEADNLVRGLKPYKLDSAIARLDKVVETITKLGRTMSIQINPQYHLLRLQELQLTADYLAKKAEEKEREREERERLREERKVQQEIEAERKRLEKEQTHYQNALRALEEKAISVHSVMLDWRCRAETADLTDQEVEVLQGLEANDFFGVAGVLGAPRAAALRARTREMLRSGSVLDPADLPYVT